METTKIAGMSIVGIKDINFTDAKGDEISGFSLFYVESDPENKSLVGVACGKFWIKRETMALAVKSAGVSSVGDLVGRKLMPTYNRHGKIESFATAKV